MPKLTITKAEHKALLESIVHWCRDIKVPLMRGRGIDDNLDWITRGNPAVDCNTGNCSLCQHAIFRADRRHGDYCNGCILTLFYESLKDGRCGRCGRCGIHGSFWQNFNDNPNLKTCNAMIAAMVLIVRNVEVE